MRRMSLCTLRRCEISCGLLAVALLFSCASAPLPSPGWETEPPEILALWSGSGVLKAGAARVALNPPFASPMAGYVGASWFRLRELRDPLFVRACVLEKGGHRFAFVVLDRVLIPTSFRAAVENRTEMQRAQVSGWIVSGTHAHTAPGGFLEAWPAEIFGMGSFDPLVFDHLVEQTARAIAEAAATLMPVRIEEASARLPESCASWVSFNRRDLDAPSDPELSVLQFLAESARISSLTSGRVVARILGFAAHPTLIPFYLRRASGDYPGVCCRTLEAPDRSVALLAMGPSADLAAGSSGDHAPAGWERRVERIGRRLALETLRLGTLPVPSETEAPFVHLMARVRLPPRVTWSVPFVGSEIASHYPEHAILQCVRLGGVLFATFPGEMSSELGARIQRIILERTKSRRVVLWTLADHYMGYAFTREALEKGGKSQHLSAYGFELGNLLEKHMTELAVRTWETWQPGSQQKKEAR